jgi:hypothetical protein
MSEQLTKIVVDCASGKQTILPLTAAEIAQRDQDAAAYEEAEATRQAKAEALAALKESAKAKLTAGEPLTDEEATAIVI